MSSTIDDFISYDDPLLLFEYFQERVIESYKNKEVDISEIVTNIALRRKIDIFDFAIKAINSGFRAFDAHHILENVIPKIDLNIESLAQYTKVIFEKFKNDMMSGIQYNPIIEISKNKPERSKELLKKLIDCNEDFTVNYIASILSNIDLSENKDRYNEIIKYLETDNQYLNQAVVVALGNFSYEDLDDDKKLKSSLSIFDRLQLMRIPDIESYICNSLCQMYMLSSDIRDRILVFATKKNPKTRYPISLLLFREIKDNDNDWFNNILYTFKDIHCEYGGILDKLDSVLYQLSSKKIKIDIVKDFLKGWISNSDYCRSKTSIDKVFDSTIYKLSENPTAFNLMISEFINSDNPNVNYAASELISFLQIHNKPLFCLDSEFIKGKDIIDVIYIIRKILGYVFDVNSINSSLFSIFDSCFVDKKVRKICEDVFIDHIGLDYPGSTIEFLTNRISEFDEKDERINSIRNIVSKIESNEQAYQSLPKLRELNISVLQQNRISLEENKVLNKTFEKAQEGALWTQIASNIPLKYGNSWFSFRDGEYCNPQKLSSFSQSYEMPRTEIFSPVSSSFEKQVFRHSKRGDK